MITFWRGKDLAYAGRPVSIFLKELGHGNGTRSGFSDVEGIVENTGSLGYKPLSDALGRDRRQDIGKRPD